MPRILRANLRLSLSCVLLASFSAASNASGFEEFLQSDKLTGNWFTVRDSLAEKGFEFNASLLSDYSVNFDGGLRQGDAFRHLFSADFAFNPDPLLNWKGALFFLNFQTHNGRDGTESLVGDFQVYDNIDSPGFTQISELWYQQELLDGKLRLKIGKVDANSEFAYVECAGDFLSSSAGNSPNILGFPTYPDPATSAILFLYPVDWFYAGVGYFDGATQDGGHGRTGNKGPATFFGDPADNFIIAEAGFKWSLTNNALPGRLAGGLWHHTGTFDHFDSGREDGATGFYTLLEQQVWRENPDNADDSQGITLFSQLACANPRVSEVDLHLSLGAAWTGPIPSRDNDALGLMATHVRFSDNPAAGFPNDSETALELFYKCQITPAIFITADIQHILNPGGQNIDNATVATLRLELVF